MNDFALDFETADHDHLKRNFYRAGKTPELQAHKSLFFDMPPVVLHLS
jgi:hypothetical protein